MTQEIKKRVGEVRVSVSQLQLQLSRILNYLSTNDEVALITRNGVATHRIEPLPTESNRDSGLTTLDIDTHLHRTGDLHER